MSHSGHRLREMKSDAVHHGHVAGHPHPSHHPHHHHGDEEEYVIEVESDLSPTGPDIIREVDHDHHNVKVKLKRRRRCGICGPCQIKQNCGRCHYCLRRDVLKQTCVYRKCVYLRSKPRSMSPKENVSMSALNLQSGLGVATPTDLSMRTSLTPSASGSSSNDFQGLSSMYHHPDLDSRAFTGSSPSIPLHHDPVIPSRMNPYMGSAHTGPYPINMFPSSSLAANSSLPNPFQMGSCSNSPFRYPWMPGSFARPSVVSSPTDLLRPSPSWPPPPTHGLSSTHQRMASDFGAESFQKDMPFMKRRSQQDLLQNRQRLPSCSRSLAPMCGGASSGCETPACFNSDALVMREKYGCFPGQGSRSLGCDSSGHMTSGTMNSSYNRGCASSQYECDVIGIDDFQTAAVGLPICSSNTEKRELSIPAEFYGHTALCTPQMDCWYQGAQDGNGSPLLLPWLQTGNLDGLSQAAFPAVSSTSSSSSASPVVYVTHAITSGGQHQHYYYHHPRTPFSPSPLTTNITTNTT